MCLFKIRSKFNEYFIDIKFWYDISKVNIFNYFIFLIVENTCLAILRYVVDNYSYSQSIRIFIDTLCLYIFSQLVKYVQIFVYKIIISV